MYILDTNAISDLMQGHPTVAARLQAAQSDAVTCVIVRGEIAYGIAKLPQSARRAAYVTRADQLFAAITCEPITERAAKLDGEIRHATESSGTRLDDNNLWIAATSYLWEQCWSHAIPIFRGSQDWLSKIGRGERRLNPAQEEFRPHPRRSAPATSRGTCQSSTSSTRRIFRSPTFSFSPAMNEVLPASSL